MKGRITEAMRAPDLIRTPHELGLLQLNEPDINSYGTAFAYDFIY
jgi:hypothetical protein